MLRLITSRRVGLALAAAVLAAVVVAVARLWRRAEDRRAASPVERSGVASPGGGPDSGAGRAPRWPPAPILGTPTDEDLRRYARPPSAVRTAVERMFERGPRTPREPLDEAARGRLVRWGAVGIGLCLLAFGTQALESAVFSNGTETVEATGFRNSPGADDMCELPRSSGPADSAARPTDEAEPPRTLIVTVCKKDECSGDSCREVPDTPEAPEVQELFEAAGEGLDPVRPYETPVPYETAETPVVVPDADCHPRVRTARVRAVDPRVTRAVNRQWRRIERWLQANAPASLRTLGKPARARTIAVAEAQMGLRFPDDLRASLLRHDGASVVADTWPFGFLGNWNQGVREIRDTWRQLCEIEGEVRGDGDARTEWWDGRMIPFGADGSGNHLVIDSVIHDVGDTDHEGMMDFEPGGVPIRSYYGLLRATAHALETGGAVGFWKPTVTGGELDWTVVEERPSEE
ncbi:SMI1/KNR4 family protein [Streptosporangium sp. NPDC023825]|uniref:SMI1/KNR4 family protein n=1 Tax=Streptosporangium sp. NPDC023825 TaxID=3154909 RepID=UPI003432C213